MTQLERLLATHCRLLTDVKKQCNVINGYTGETRPSILVSRKNTLEEIWPELRTNINTIESVRDWIGTEEFNDKIAEVRETYLDTLAHLMDLLPADATATLQNSLLLGRNQTNQSNRTNIDPG